MPQRSLLRYLLLPRPKDLAKGWILPTTFLLASLGGGGVSSLRLLKATVVWVVLELLIYQARYQWNDIRGFEADQRHPDAVSRGRLPGPPERSRPHKLASAAVASLRLGAVAAIACLAPLHLGTIVGALSAGVLGIAVVYEQLRTRATGRSSEVPPRLRGALLGLWVLVGAGYALRGVAGVALAVDLGGRTTFTAGAVVAMWCYGIAFVTSRWVVEALAFARVERGKLVWEVGAGQAREHLLALVRWLPKEGPPASSGARPRRWQPLRCRTRFSSPWNIASLVSAVATALAGTLLGGGHIASGAVVGVAGGLLAAVVLRSLRRLPVLAAAAGGLATLLLVIDVPKPGVALLVWLVLMCAQLVFLSQSLDNMGRQCRLALGTGWAWLASQRRASDVVGIDA